MFQGFSAVKKSIHLIDSFAVHPKPVELFFRVLFFAILLDLFLSVDSLEKLVFKEKLLALIFAVAVNLEG